ncbi:ABC transporter ATP-binding protein [Marinibactrum halimedae]|uniref:ABC transporter ATP-binding protein n=1 Tax=Marinibactrum halimedae TaxID=1444977 RepID=A0AA37T4A3_9GAMM|nr:ABC transporter ATP-binding protein [Marinibactrum halimedae]
MLGPSGCGKTTILRAIAGFHPLSEGEIRLANQKLSTPQGMLAPEKRGVGMVFQDYALFPHLSVSDNIAFGLKPLPHDQQKRITTELLTLVKLENMGERYPDELSGGQQQRVALARALSTEPSLLLLDEPFSNLDVELRRLLAVEVRSILKQRGITAIMVTHDQEEAFAFADNIGVMNQGTLCQWDTPYNLYHEPNNRFVASFIGQGAFLPGRTNSATEVTTELGTFKSKHSHWHKDANVEVLFRPDDVLHSPESPIKTIVQDKAFTGAATLYTLSLPSGKKVLANFSSHHDYPIGETVGINIDAQHLIVFPQSTIDIE